MTDPTTVTKKVYCFEDLWPFGIYPEITFVTGGIGSGKSTLTTGTGVPMERHFVADFEKSQAITSKQLGLEYWDVLASMNKKYPGGYSLSTLYKDFTETMDRIPEGRFDVIVLDNASILEDAIAEFVKTNPTKFGGTVNQFSSMEGVMWGAVKVHYGQLLIKWLSKAKMIFIVMHLRDEWANKKPVIDPVTGRAKKEPKGKETLEQLSSLSVWLEKGEGGKPSARVLKTRIDRKYYVSDPEEAPVDLPSQYLKELLNSEGVMEPGTVTVRCLPPRLPRCEWTAIRNYIRHPVDMQNLLPGEKPKDGLLTDDDRLLLKARITDNESIIAQAQRAVAETGEARTKQNLVDKAYAKYGFTGQDIKECLTDAGLMPFSPENWDRMLQSLHDWSISKQASKKEDLVHV